MYGPEPRGHWTGPGPQKAFKLLTPGARYRVSKSFLDYDGVGHPAGESWRFLGYNFAPYDDGLSLFVSLDDRAEWHIRMQWRADAQGPIIDRLEDYVRPAD